MNGNVKTQQLRMASGTTTVLTVEITTCQVISAPRAETRK